MGELDVGGRAHGEGEANMQLRSGRAPQSVADFIVLHSDRLKILALVIFLVACLVRCSARRLRDGDDVGMALSNGNWSDHQPFNPRLHVEIDYLSNPLAG